MTGARLHLVSAYREPTPAMAAAEAPTMFVADLTADAIRALTAHVGALADRLRDDGIDVATRVELGGVAATLVEVADAVDADLLVVAASRVFADCWDRCPAG